MATFAAVNMSASARRHEKQPGWYLIRWIVVLSLAVVLLPVIGASLALASISISSSGGFLAWPLVGIAILGAVFAAFYKSTGERHPLFAGFATVAAGLVLSTAEGLAILNVPASTGDVLPGVQLVVYMLLVVLGAVVAVWVGRRVRWPQR
ncbi:MAG TPA: hypothetical protein VFL29_08135 [Candidatus Dormibacteraeota bacterium]|nr:hypothetical protein [Candidatus Dormibacteraeota bacterium]